MPLPRTLPIAASLLLVLQGCKVGPDYARPAQELPATFRGQAAATDESLADLPWWEVYKDPTLQELIRGTLRNNLDLRIAISRIEQARAAAAESKSQLYPSVGYGANVSSGRNESLGIPTYTDGTSSTPVAAVISAAWELDVWGRVRRSNEAALAQYLATEEARRGVLLTLVSDVSRAYFELLELDLQRSIAKLAAASFADSLRIFTLRLQGGTASKLETSRAEAAMTASAAAIPEIERQIIAKENQINLLMGRPPGPVPRTVQLMDGLVPPEVPAGIPASLLERRPDIRLAEQRLRAANAQIGVSVANFYPQIGLTAFLGKVSPEVGALTAGSTNAWSIAATATGPIFTAGLLTAQLEQARAVWQQTALEYDRTVLNSLRDVSDALTAKEKLAAARQEQARSVAAYEVAVDIATKRFNAGKASYYEVLEAQQLLFPQMSQLARVRLEQLVAVVSLYKALGGGWNLKATDWGETTPAPAPPDGANSAGGASQTSRESRAQASPAL